MWYQDQSILGIGAGAILTMALLIVAPAGPFFPRTGIAGISLWIPLLTLVLLASIMWTYKFGSPFDGSLTRQARTRSIVVIALVVIFPSLALGQQYVDTIKDDIRSPDVSSPEALDVVNSVSDYGIEQRRLIFRQPRRRLASRPSSANSRRGFLAP